MALVLADRVRDTTTTTGTGTVTLSGTAPTGYQNFSVIGNANTTYYTINAGSEWEVGIGTYSATGPTLARNTVLESSNANALVNFSAGTKDVFVTYPSDKSVNYDEANNLTVTGRTTLAAPNTSAAAWTTAGINLVQNAATFTDTTSSGTVTNVYMNNFGAQTLAASSAVTASNLYGTFFTAPVAGANVTATNTFALGADTLRVLGTINGAGISLNGGVIFNTAASNISIGTSQTTGILTLGNTAGTGTITLGQSTVSQTTNIQAGATASGSTKTINIGTSGAAGSTTSIAIGAAAGTSATTVNQTLSVTGTLNVGASLNVNGITSNTNIGTSQTTGLLTLGNTAGTGIITLGQSTVSQTTNIQAGATASGSTKTINIGTGGLSGSTSTITIGSTAGTSTTTVNGALVLSSALPVASGGTGATTLTGVVIGNGTSAFTTVAAPSGAIVGTTDTQTLTNKRVTPRMNSQTTTTSPWAWNSDSFDNQSFTALANALTINADAGTPTDGQRTVLRFKDNGTAQALTWTTGSSKAFRAVGVTLPTTTVIGKTVYVGCLYNTADSRWDVVAVSQEA